MKEQVHPWPNETGWKERIQFGKELHRKYPQLAKNIIDYLEGNFDIRRLELELNEKCFVIQSIGDTVRNLTWEWDGLGIENYAPVGDSQEMSASGFEYDAYDEGVFGICVGVFRDQKGEEGILTYKMNYVHNYKTGKGIPDVGRDFFLINKNIGPLEKDVHYDDENLASELLMVANKVLDNLPRPFPITSRQKSRLQILFPKPQA